MEYGSDDEDDMMTDTVAQRRANRACVRLRSFLDLGSYCDTQVQSNPFILKETACTKTCGGKTIGVEEYDRIGYRIRKRQGYIG